MANWFMQMAFPNVAQAMDEQSALQQIAGALSFDYRMKNDPDFIRGMTPNADYDDGTGRPGFSGKKGSPPVTDPNSGLNTLLYNSTKNPMINQFKMNYLLGQKQGPELMAPEPVMVMNPQTGQYEEKFARFNKGTGGYNIVEGVIPRGQNPLVQNIIGGNNVEYTEPKPIIVGDEERLAQFPKNQPIGGNLQPNILPRQYKPQGARDELNKKLDIVGRVEQSLNDYESKLKNIGAEILPSKDKLSIQSSYTQLLLELKELNNLGVLNGPDLMLMERSLLDPTSMTAKGIESFYGKDALLGQLQIVRDKLNAARQRAQELYSGNTEGRKNKPKQEAVKPKKTIRFEDLP